MAEIEPGYRPVVMGTNGLVTAGHHLAAAAGARVLMDGANAADAAVAAAGVLAVTMPAMCGIGGDAFVLVWRPAQGRVEAINASGPAPRRASRAIFPDGLPDRGIRSAAVPGVVAGWDLLLRRHGTRPLGDLLRPAIRYAEAGFPVSYRLHKQMTMNLALLQRDEAAARAMLRAGRPYAPGELLVQSDLGKSLRRIAELGSDAFYRGPIAEAIVRASHARDGLFAAEDFGGPMAHAAEPVRTTYRGYTVYEEPPQSQGMTVLAALNLLEGFDLQAAGAGTADTLHLMIEALKLAMADRDTFVADPAFVKVPVTGLLDKAYAAAQRKRIDPRRAANSPGPGQPTDTTLLCTVDREGNAVALIQSLFLAFGSGVVADGTGLFLNNRLWGFNTTPGHANCIEPGKRTAHTLNTFMAFRDDRPALLGGTPGGPVQVQANVQVITNVLDFGMNPQAAIEAPRWFLERDGGLKVEARIEAAVRTALAARGHAVRLTEAWDPGCGGMQVIAFHPESGAAMAGADPRREGYAVAV